MEYKNREEFYKKIADDLVKFFISIRNLENNVFVEHIKKENHVIPDTIIAKLRPAETLKNYTEISIKYREADYISEKAQNLLKENSGKISLRYDHMIPKNLYLKEIKEKCLNKEKSEEELKKEIFDILEKKYFVATITADENDALSKNGLGNRMPENCDENDIFARYKKIGINLIKTGLFDK